MRVLKDKFPQIVDALDVGGSGDMYAGLDEEERGALLEVTRMGFPPQSWFGYKTMGVHAFGVLYPGIVQADPQYFTDFWRVPGYLGAKPPESLIKARIQHHTTVKLAIAQAEANRMGLAVNHLAGQARGTADKAWQSLQESAAKIPVAFQLASAPPRVDFLGGDLAILTGAAAGMKVSLRQVVGDIVVVGVADPKVLSLIKAGDQVQVDNSNSLAAQTYHRHQVPGPDFHAEASDYTLQAALLKVIDNLRRQMQSRKNRQLDRRKNNSKLGLLHGRSRFVLNAVRAATGGFTQGASNA